MRWLLLLILSCFSLTSVFAQDEDVKKQINKIKKSSHYIYAEATSSDEVGARQDAEMRLYEEINRWVYHKKKMKGTSLIVTNKKELWTVLSMPRGNNKFRSFIYVKKSDIVPVDNAVVLENQNIPSVHEALRGTLPIEIQRLSEYKTYSELIERVKSMKLSGRIRHYGNYAELERPEDYYLVIYNTNAKIVALLTPGKFRVNIKNNQTDHLRNYEGCSVIGIKLDNENKDKND